MPIFKIFKIFYFHIFIYIKGNIIKIKQNEFFPADLIILKTSDPKGACFIETKNLDGETNLKFKTAHKDLISDFKTNE